MRANSWRGEAISRLILDVGHFKRFNDNYGHLHGDDGLREVAKAIEQAVKRPGDLPARSGGDEFALLLPGTPRVGALEVEILYPIHYRSG